MPNAWITRATTNLLARSRATTFAAAKREWAMTMAYRDLRTPRGTCELCEQPRIRHTFEIANVATEARLWIGSECITKFVPVYAGDAEVIGRAKATYVAATTNTLIHAARRQRAFAALDALAAADARFGQPDWKEHWEVGYSVKQLLMVSAVAARHGVAFSADDFRINTRRGKIVEQLDGIAPWQYARVRGALTPARRREFDPEFGYEPKRA